MEHIQSSLAIQVQLLYFLEHPTNLFSIRIHPKQTKNVINCKNKE